MNISKCLLMISLSLIMGTFTTSFSNVKASVDQDIKLQHENEQLKEQLQKLKHRLKQLEPTEPVNIQDPPWEEPPFPSLVKPIPEIINKGTKIPFEVIVNKTEYERPAYETQWHSTYSGGRWSYVPTRIHYALHRLFTTYDIGISAWYDFEHNMGFSIPMFQDEKELDLYIVAFQMEVIDVYTKGNQVVVVGNPKRKGVQVITVTTADITPSNKKDTILVQLATQKGNEIDYSITSYFPADFWSKQKKN